jgi:hypothetical protein
MDDIVEVDVDSDEDQLYDDVKVDHPLVWCLVTAALHGRNLAVVISSSERIHRSEILNINFLLPSGLLCSVGIVLVFVKRTAARICLCEGECEKGETGLTLLKAC